jgi:hypothetical protein
MLDQSWTKQLSVHYVSFALTMRLRSKLWLASMLRKWAYVLDPHYLEEQKLAENERGQSNPEARRAAPITHTIVDVNDSVLQEYRQDQKEQAANERANRRTAKWALGVAAGIALIGMWQARLTREANFTGQTSLQLSERAWVGVTAIQDGTPDMQQYSNGKTVPTNINADLTLQNFGKSPAIAAGQFLPVLWPFTGKTDFERVSQTACATAARNFQNKTTTQIIFPTQSTTIRVHSGMPVKNKPAGDGNRYLYVIGCVIYSDNLTTCDASKPDLPGCRITRYCAQTTIRPQNDWSQPIQTTGFEFCPMLNDMYH